MNRHRWIVCALIGQAATLMGATVVGQAPPAPAPGIYLQVPGKSGDEGSVKLRGVMVTEMKQKGMLKMIATSGIAKSGVIGAIPGGHATVRVPAGDIAFTISLNTGRAGSGPANLEQMMNAMNGDSMPAGRTAEDFVLLRMTPKDNTREAELGKQGRSGRLENSKDAVPCSLERVSDNVFRVRPKDALPPGEYAFTANGQAGAGGQLWDFGVDGK